MTLRLAASRADRPHAHRAPVSPRPRLPRAALTLVRCAAARAPPCQAQYKVIGADGKVTYTDRAPSASEGQRDRRSAAGARRSPSRGRARPAVRAAPGGDQVPGHALHHHRRLRPMQRRAPAAEAARHPVHREAGRRPREDSEALERLVGRARRADAHASARRSCAATPPSLDRLPRRRRLSARVAAAVDLPVPGRRAAWSSAATPAAARGAKPRHRSPQPVATPPPGPPRPAPERHPLLSDSRPAPLGRAAAAARPGAPATLPAPTAAPIIQNSADGAERRAGERRTPAASPRSTKLIAIERSAIASPWRSCGVIWCSVVMIIGCTAPSARPRTTAHSPITQAACTNG